MAAKTHRAQGSLPAGPSLRPACGKKRSTASGDASHLLSILLGDTSPRTLEKERAVRTAPLTTPA